MLHTSVIILSVCHGAKHCTHSSLLIYCAVNAVGLQLAPTCVRTTITMKIVTSFNPVKHTLIAAKKIVTVT